jgi:sugar lactone lactonase YvrE
LVLVLICLVIGAAGGSVALATAGSTPDSDPHAATPSRFVQTAQTSAVQHLEYVLQDQTISVYDIDHGFAALAPIELSQLADGVRGVTTAPTTHVLFIAHGGDGGGSGNGSVLAYDMVAKTVLWDKRYSSGIDSLAISHDGQTLYVPSGENDSSGNWNIVSAATGAITGTITAGAGAHDGVMSADGVTLLLGGRNHAQLEWYNTATHQLRSSDALVNGVRPLTINGNDSRAFTTATGFDGFQEIDLNTGHVLFTEQQASYPGGFQYSTASHGISLSPDSKTLYVLDTVNNTVHVWDVTGTPVQKANISVQALTGNQAQCAYDCARDGWIQTSTDGHYVFVGDSGDVIDTSTNTVVGHIGNLRDSRETIEVDWSGGVPVSTSTRQGVGAAMSATSPAPTAPALTPPASGSGAIISGLTVSPAVFAAAGRGAAISGLSVSPDASVAAGRGAAIARRRPSTGTTISYSDSQAATTTFTVLRGHPGVERVRRGCVKPSRAVPKIGGRRCTRYVRVGSFIHIDRGGPNRFRFTGRMAGRALRPGRYLLQALPIFGGRTATPRARTFRIIP